MVSAPPLQPRPFPTSGTPTLIYVPMDHALKFAKEDVINLVSSVHFCQQFVVDFDLGSVIPLLILILDCVHNQRKLI